MKHSYAMKYWGRHLLACLVILTISPVHGEESASTETTPYPTATVVDYVLGCMLSNGNSPDLLQKCSCSIDFITQAIPYEEYEKTETLLRLQQMPGAGRTLFYKNSNWAKNAITRLREVQAESTLRCF
jgi:hypothetical protein